jgi:hypothetical protein
VILVALCYPDWNTFLTGCVVYHESINERRLTYEYRCDERLKTKNEESSRKQTSKDPMKRKR